MPKHSGNNLSRKGLHVIRNRFLGAVRLSCFLVAATAVGVPADASAAVRKTPTAKSSSAPKRLTLKKPRTSSAARRRAASARARAAALREAIEPRFKLDDTGSVVPDLRAEAAIIYNPENGKVLWESNSTSRLSIASITKVMTATVFLENQPDLTREVVVERADVRAASTTYLRAGYKITTGDLLHLLLIASDNAAARVLARVSPYGAPGFIARMNEKGEILTDKEGRPMNSDRGFIAYPTYAVQVEIDKKGTVQYISLVPVGIMGQEIPLSEYNVELAKPMPLRARGVNSDGSRFLGDVYLGGKQTVGPKGEEASGGKMLDEMGDLLPPLFVPQGSRVELERLSVQLVYDENAGIWVIQFRSRPREIPPMVPLEPSAPAAPAVPGEGVAPPVGAPAGEPVVEEEKPGEGFSLWGAVIGGLLGLLVFGGYWAARAIGQDLARGWALNERIAKWEKNQRKKVRGGPPPEGSSGLEEGVEMFDGLVSLDGKRVAPEGWIASGLVGLEERRSVVRLPSDEDPLILGRIFVHPDLWGQLPRYAGVEEVELPKKVKETPFFWMEWEPRRGDLVVLPEGVGLRRRGSGSLRG